MEVLHIKTCNMQWYLNFTALYEFYKTQEGTKINSIYNRDGESRGESERKKGRK